MDVLTPPKISVESLNRSELLKLISRRAFYFSRRDLLRARWDAHCDRAAKIREAELAALQVYSQLAEIDGRSLKPHAFAALRRKREAAWDAYQSASRRAEQACDAQERAYRALDACPGGV